MDNPLPIAAQKDQENQRGRQQHYALIFEYGS